MTEQEIFDKAARHLLTQKAKAFYGETGTCAYRGKDNLQCAFGPFIPDELYYEGLEGKVASDVIDELELTELFDHKDFCVELQSIHDNHKVWAWRAKLRDFAYNHGLSEKVLDDFK